MLTGQQNGCRLINMNTYGEAAQHYTTIDPEVSEFCAYMAGNAEWRPMDVPAMFRRLHADGNLPVPAASVPCLDRG